MNPVERSRVLQESWHTMTEYVGQQAFLPVPSNVLSPHTGSPPEAGMQFDRTLALLLVFFFAVAATAQIAESRNPRLNPAEAASNIGDCGLVSAHVVNTDGRPATGATIEMHSLESGNAQALETAIDGSSEMNCVAPGWYRITARSGAARAYQDVQVGDTPQTVTLQLNDPSKSSSRGTVSAASLMVPDKARKALDKARELIVKVNYDAALGFIKKAMQIYPKSSEAYELRGLIFLVHSEDSKAVNDFQQSIQLDAGNAMSRIMMGSALNDSKNFKEALVTLESAQPLAPNSWQLNYELGRAYAGTGKLRDALSALTKAMQLNPNFVPLRFARGIVLLRARHFSDAASDLKAYLEKQPAGPEAKTAKELLATAMAGIQTK